MRRLFIPVKENNYHAFLLRKPMLALYLLIILISNIVFGSAALLITHAAVDFNTLYRMHNEERSKRGLSTLSINNKLSASATAKAKAMLASDCWSHYCPDGKSPWDFFDAAGYIYLYAGENLAEGFADNDAVMNAWMNSPTHRDNIINKKFDEIGIGFATGAFQNIQNNTIIVVHFGTTAQSQKVVPVVTATATASTTPTPQLIHSINIENPVDGSQSNGKNLEISGSAKNIEMLELKANDNSLGKVPVSGGLFTYRPNADQLIEEKSYSLQGFAQIEGKQIVSNKININIDKTAPVLNLNNVQIENGTDVLSLYISGVTAHKVNLNNTDKEFQKNSEENWSLTISKAEAALFNNFSIVATDIAGNTSDLELRNPASALALKSAQNEAVASTTEFAFPQFFKNQSSIINFSFLVFMSGLFGMDYIIMQKSGLTGQKRSSSAMNLLLFLGLAILILVGSASGEILNGINL